MPPILLHIFPTFSVGGQQTRFATIANRLGLSYRHRLVSLDGGDEAISLIDPAIDFSLIPVPGEARSLPGQFRLMSRLMGSLEPDILITYNWGAIEWAMFNRLFARRKHIHLEDGFGPDEADHQKWRRVITRQLMLRRSTVVVPSRNLKNIAVGQWRLQAERVVYIPNGIDSGRFDRPSTREAKPFSAQRDGECVIGTFSPLRPEKNIGRMLRAFAEIRAPSRRLVICGDGPELPKLREIAKRLALEKVVTFAGHVQKPEEVMGAFDLFAITSDTEQMPYAVLEAMSARLPIVGTAVGDIPIMVAEENRPYIVPRDSHAALAEALQRLCADAELRRKLGIANRSRVDRDFGIAQMTAAFRRLL